MLQEQGSAHRSRSDLLGAATLVVMWSSGFIGADLGTTYAPAATLLSWRYLAAGALLAVLFVLTRQRVGRGALGRQAVLGVLCQCFYLTGVVGGVGLGVPAGTAALITALQPLVVAALSGPFLGERTTGWQRAGLVLGIVGVALVVGGDVSSGSAPWWAYLLPMAGMLSLSGGTVLERRWDPPESLLQTITLQSITAAGFFLLVALSRHQVEPPAAGAFWLAVAWVVVLSSFGGYGAYIWVARSQGATRVSALLYLTPAATMLWAYLMFGDPVTPLGFLGLAVSGTAVILVLGSRPVSAAASRERRSARSPRSSRTLPRPRSR